MPRWRVLLVAVVVGLLAGAGVHAGGVLDALEQDALEARHALRGAETPGEVAVVAVDGRTFSELGWQWPFKRSSFGKIAERLHAAGARQIVFDVQFTEESEPKEDLALYDAIGRIGGAVLATSESDERGRTNVLGGDENLAAIGSRAAASTLPDEDDGIIQRFTAMERRLPTLAAVVAQRLGRPLDPTLFPAEGAYIDFRGPAGTVPTESFVDVLRGRSDPEIFRGRVVVVGTSAPTLHDVHPTPAGHDLMPGPEVQANAIWTALHGLPLRDVPRWGGALLVLLLAGVVPLLAVLVRPGVAAACTPALGLAYCSAAQLLFEAGIVVPVVAPTVALVVASVVTVGGSLLAETRERRRFAELSHLLKRMVDERTRELRETELEIVHRLAYAVESRDEETGEHIDRMSELCRRLALAAGIDPEEAELIRRASALHDVGKIGVPDHILSKPGRLDDEEMAQMRRHAAVGGEILAGSRSPLVQLAEVIARGHHEKWDGTGYPSGLVGEDIPLPARIAAVCDVFDALTSERPYKRAWPVADALAEIRDQAGRHFDPELVRLFSAMGDDLLAERGEGPVERPDLRLVA